MITSLPISGGMLAIGEDFSDHPAGGGGEDRVDVLVIGQGDEPDGEGPAPASPPRRIIDRERGTEHVPRLRREERPCNDQVAGGIAYPQTAEVNGCADAALMNQQLPW